MSALAIAATIQYEQGGTRWHDTVLVPAAKLLESGLSVADWLIENEVIELEWELVDVMIEEEV